MGIEKSKGTRTKVVIYQAPGGALELRGDVTKETIWATLDQIAAVFGRDKSVISRHLKNIYNEGELELKATVAKNATVQIEGNRQINRTIEYYNLDAIISVGYRVNSKTATRFRQWATKILRQHITKGFTINPKVIKNNYAEFQRAIQSIKYLLPAGVKMDQASVLELVSAFADTWLSLDAYDKDAFVLRSATKKSVALSAEQLAGVLVDFKAALVKKGEATELFGNERSVGVLQGIVGNVLQSFGGTELYPSIQEKAAHLLYFMVKNHPYVDGNKRSGAFAFVWFLRRAGALDTSRLTPEALTALTLLIAESNPKDKVKMTSLVAMLLGKPLPQKSGKVGR